jgi:hypothetical protein
MKGRDHVLNPYKNTGKLLCCEECCLLKCDKIQFDINVSEAPALLVFTQKRGDSCLRQYIYKIPLEVTTSLFKHLAMNEY